MKTHVMMAVLLTAFLVGGALPVLSQTMSKQDYLDKSKRQKTTGFIMLGGGAALATAGAIQFNENFNLSGGGEAEGIMMVAGTLVALGSIPMFISSGRNAKKAASLSFRNEPTNIPKYAGNLPPSVPSLSLTIPLH